MARYLIRNVLPALAALSLAATVVAEDKASPYVRNGRALYVQYCVACHGPSGRGDGPVAQTLKTEPADLTKISQRHNGFPADRVMIWIDGEKAVPAHGTREMPVWGARFRRTSSQAEALGAVYALTRYLQTIQK